MPALPLRSSSFSPLAIRSSSVLSIAVSMRETKTLATEAMLSIGCPALTRSSRPSM